MTLLAWAPNKTEDGILLTVVWIHPKQEMSQDLYFCPLGDRLQAMFEASDDPNAVVDWIVEWLYSDGLFPHVGALPLEQAGQSIATTQGIVGRLDYRDMIPHPMPKPTEMSQAREILNDEKIDPINGLERWVSRITRLP